MPPIYCKYHRQVPARYECPRCRVAWCTQCAKPQPGGNNARCPVCRTELESLGIGNTIQPFWERIPRFFAYPADSTILTHLSLLTLLSFAALLPIVGIFIYLLITLALLKYGYLVLEETSRGNLKPTMQLTERLSEGNGLVFKQFGVFVVMGFLVLTIAARSPVLGGIAALLALLSVPATIITLALEESFTKAINPAHIASIIRRIGWPYLLLYFFLLLLSSGSAAAKALIEPIVPEWLFLVCSTFVGGYFTVIMFHLMGYVVYQYHEPLGIAGVKEFEAATQTKSGADEPPLLHEINILLAEGKPEEAKERLGNELRHTNDLRLHERYHKLLEALKDAARLTEHGKRYIQLLMHMEKSAKAVEVFTTCNRIDPQFNLDDAAQTLALAKFAATMQRHDTALRALSGYSQRFPRNREIPAAYFLAAQLLCERKNDLAQAKKILNSLIAKFPGHLLEPEIRSYLQRVEDLEKPLSTAPR